MDFTKVTQGRACVVELDQPTEQKYLFEKEDETQKLVKATSFKVHSNFMGKIYAFLGLAVKVKSETAGKFIFVNKSSFINFSARALSVATPVQTFTDWAKDVQIVYTKKNSPEHKKVVNEYHVIAKEEFKNLTKAQKNETLQKFAFDFVGNLDAKYQAKHPIV